MKKKQRSDRIKIKHENEKERLQIGEMIREGEHQRCRS